MKPQACQLLCGKGQGTRAVGGFRICDTCVGRVVAIATDAGVPEAELAALRAAPDVGERPAFWSGTRKPKAKAATPAPAPRTRAPAARRERPAIHCRTCHETIPREPSQPGRPPMNCDRCCSPAERRRRERARLAA